jgi:hypothetical protein
LIGGRNIGNIFCLNPRLVQRLAGVEPGVVGDVGVDDVAPGGGAVCVDVFVLGYLDSLVEGLSQVDDGFGQARLMFRRETKSNLGLRFNELEAPA